MTLHYFVLGMLLRAAAAHNFGFAAAPTGVPTLYALCFTCRFCSLFIYRIN